MGITNEAFNKYKETRALRGYKSAWLVKHPDDTSGKYSLIGATETAPYVFGAKDSSEFDLLQMPTIGKVEGKFTLDEKEVEVMHHRDNAYRFEKLKGRVLEFMTINSEFVGYKFTGTLDYKPNDADSDVNKATVTITPLTADTKPILNARALVVEALCFANAIPEAIKTSEKVNFSVMQSGVTPTLAVKKITINPITGVETEEIDSSVVTTDITQVQFSTSGLYAITASATGYAPWTTTVFVDTAS